MAALDLGIQYVLSLVLPVLVFRLSWRWLRVDQRARAWPDVSLYSAVLAFGPLCLPFHFARVRVGPARWSSWLSIPVGVLLGCASIVVCVLPGVLVATMLEALTMVGS